MKCKDCGVNDVCKGLCKKCCDRLWRKKNIDKCKKYQKEYNKEYRKKNKDKLRRYAKEYRQNNKDKIKEFYERNKEKIKEYKKEYMKKYRRKNKEKLKLYLKKWREENKEYVKEYNKTKKYKEYQKEYSKNNKRKVKEYCARLEVKVKKREYMKEWRKKNKNKISINDKQRRKIDKKWAIKERVRSSFNQAIKRYSTIGKIMSKSKYLNMPAIIEYLKPFSDLSLYEVDHIIPLVKFNHDDLEQIRKAWLPSNLQWLPKEINRWKGNRLIKPLTEEQKEKLLKKLQKK